MRHCRFIIAVITSVMTAASCISEIDTSSVPEPSESELALATKSAGRMSADHQKGFLLIYVDEQTVARIEKGEIDRVAYELFSGMEIRGFEPALSHMPKNKEVARELGLHRWFTITFDESIPVRRIAQEVAMRPEICLVQFNNLAKPASDCKSIPFRPQPKLMAAAQEGATIPFDDPMNSYQWNLNNTGDKKVAATARAGADVGVMDAWKLTTGTPDVIVAICDAPVKYTHPDLEAAMWVNEAELNGVKGVDDDGNDYIDDIYGYNFYKGSGSHGAINWESAGETGHGTHVAGIIGAVNGNGLGVSSIAGGSGNGDGVRLMTCQLFEGAGSAGDAGMAEALMYAADNGACIAQCSYGYPAYTFENDKSFMDNAPLEYRAINYFIHPKNAKHPALESNIIIFAAGNESASESDYPGALPVCVSVTGLGADYLPAGYTNYGKGCNLAAPGGDLWIGSYKEEENISQILSTCISEVASDYAWMQGTSMACPHVSGVAALGVSYAGKLGKRFTREEFTSLLLTSVNDINQLIAEADLKPFKDLSFSLRPYRTRMGTGAIDAWKLLMQIEGTPSVMIKSGTTSSISLEDFFGESYDDLTYLSVEIDDDAKKTLGLASSPRIEKGVLNIACMKNGSAKIRVYANVGGTEISRELSIISRGVYSENGGWF
ncbi:MAG: S8 family serine peptidase [Bacteroidales bacterium]|nr:S8 family serine peptidase [Bacteroidales bacterium]MBR5862746.1 S8 family serine peptidase [Bacteroidales bacterium]